jgi:hypothetical protein
MELVYADCRGQKSSFYLCKYARSLTNLIAKEYGMDTVPVQFSMNNLNFGMQQPESCGMCKELKMSYFNLVNLYIILVPFVIFFATRFVFLKVQLNKYKIVAVSGVLLLNVVPLLGGIFGPVGLTSTTLDGAVHLDFGFLFMFNIVAILLSYFLTNKKQILK